MRIRSLLALAVVPVAAVAPLAGARAQSGARPQLEWRTLETPHFVFHFPAEDAEWARFAAARMEAEFEPVARLVGYTIPDRVTVVVENPADAANGATYPLVRGSSIVLWPTPPGPRITIGHTRGFTEELTTHELAHAAHLARPSRNARFNRLTSLLPVEPGPIFFRTPRWVNEGYATYVEGRLTGSGRPHGVERAAVLRELALEGRLPTYAGMSSPAGFRGGDMAYLVGSAYLEWLSNRGGDSSLVHLWRRLSARTPRSFDAAFAGVYGEAPAPLYDRFRAEITADAFALERARGGHALPAAVGGGAAVADSARLDSLRGRFVQHFAYAGDPAASRDGRLIAMSSYTPGAVPLVLVLSTTPDTLTAAQRRARDRARALDPEDVAPVEHFPRPLHVVSRLGFQHGQSFRSPRFFADGRRLLLTRSVARADGSFRPQLFVWDRTTGAVRQVTHDGGGVLEGDPSPDGSQVAAVRCDAGRCDLVLVTVSTGATRTLARGSFDGPYVHPRFAPDGRSVVASVQGGGRWRPVLVDATTGAVRALGPEDAFSRYDPAFTPDGRAVLVTSEASGVADLERIDLATGATAPLTAVTGGAYAPEPAPDGRSAWFLSVTAGGYDLRVASLDSAIAARVARVAPLPNEAYALAARVPDARVDAVTPARVGPERGYGVGPRHWSAVPGYAGGEEGALGVLSLNNTDPIGRLSLVAQGALGGRATWRGASLGAHFAGTVPALAATGFFLDQRPTRGGEARPAAAALDARYAGGLVSAEANGDWQVRKLRGMVGGSAGSLSMLDGQRTSRAFGFADADGTALFGTNLRSLTLRARASGAAGRTAGTSWRRGSVGASIALRGIGPDVTLDGDAGATNADAPAFEQFAIGGLASPITPDALFGQRAWMPVLPTGALVGTRLATYRLSLPLGASSAYLWGGSAGVRFGRGWQRVAGIESHFSVDDLWLARVPRLRFMGGVGVPLDRPEPRTVRGYAALTWEP